MSQAVKKGNGIFAKDLNMLSKKWLILGGIVFLLVLALAGGCSSGEQGSKVKGDPVPVAYASGFGVYEEVPILINPAVKPYKVNPDLSNITNQEMFWFSPAARDLLVQNNFVVVPNQHLSEFFILYEMNRYEPLPSLITTDSMLHNYHLFFSHLLKITETEKLAPEILDLNKAMLTQAQKQYADLKGTGWENAAKRNVGYFAVACKLLEPGMPIPDLVKSEVTKELSLIEQHQGLAVSPVMNIGPSGALENGYQEDYSQYIPRGHYDKTDLLKSYFKSMMWYGRLTFRLVSEDETRSAVLISLALNNDRSQQIWDKIYDTTNFFVGQSDDISCHQFQELLDKTYGPGTDVQAVVSKPDLWNVFLAAARDLEPPAINSLPLPEGTLEDDRESEIKGFRFMGQRYTLDADVFQRLLYPEVMENSRGQYRVLPQGMDVPAAMGSEEAYGILASAKETDYRNYPENMAHLKARIAGLPEDNWNQNLYWGWLHALRPLTIEKGDGYPSFMRNNAWARKELNTFLGSWAELKHDTILYAKQVYAEAGGGGNVDDRGYVEPNPHLYARLASLVKMTREGMQARELLTERDRASLERLEQLALSLKTISEKELTNTSLNDQEYKLIRDYGVQLEHFWLEALREEGIDHRSQAYERPAALVVDVATNPGGGQVLEVATGPVYEIYAVVPVEGQLRIVKGGVYSYYEFPWPMNDRLTDTKWHNMLREGGEAPPLPEWTSSYISHENS